MDTGQEELLMLSAMARIFLEWMDIQIIFVNWSATLCTKNSIKKLLSNASNRFDTHLWNAAGQKYIVGTNFFFFYGSKCTICTGCNSHILTRTGHIKKRVIIKSLRDTNLEFLRKIRFNRVCTAPLSK